MEIMRPLIECTGTANRAEKDLRVHLTSFDVGRKELERIKEKVYSEEVYQFFSRIDKTWPGFPIGIPKSTEIGPYPSTSVLSRR